MLQKSAVNIFDNFFVKKIKPRKTTNIFFVKMWKWNYSFSILVAITCLQQVRILHLNVCPILGKMLQNISANYSAQKLALNIIK